MKTMDVLNLVKEALRSSCEEFIAIVERAIQLLLNERSLAEGAEVIGKLVRMRPQGTAIIASDIHGDLASLITILKRSRFIEMAKEDGAFLILLGDYSDRGPYSAEVYYVLLRLKDEFPERVILLRGNHEGPEDLLASPHDLPYQLRNKFEGWRIAYRSLRTLFDHLYNAVWVKGLYLMVHGGIPSSTTSLEDLAYAHLRHPKEPLLEELLWNDPVEIDGLHPSPRGAGLLFGRDITRAVLGRVNARVLIRGHEPCYDGYKVDHEGKVLTVFSRKGPPYFNERGAYLRLELSKEVESAKQLIEFVNQF